MMQQNDQINAHAIILWSSDTDVIVLTVYLQWFIGSQPYVTQRGKNGSINIVDVMTVSKKHEKAMCNVLPGLHTYSVCDKVGSAVPVTQQLIQDFEKAVCMLYKHQGADVN